MPEGLLPVPQRGRGLLDYRPTPRDRAYGLLGADPSVDRATFLPMGRTAEGDLTFAWPGALLDMAKSAMLPGHVVQGGAWTPQDAAEMALDYGMLGTGAQASRALAGGREGILGAMDPATTRMFAGEGAKTADTAALKAAQDMAERGVDRDAIWSETGWFKDVDGRWKFEIPDDDAFLETPPGAPPGYERLQHDDLEAAYPEMMRALQQSVSPADRASGRYVGDFNTIVAKGPTPSARRSVGLHELQHVVQGQEGFARGGSPSEFTRQADALGARDILAWRGELQRLRAERPKADWIALDNEAVRQYRELGLEIPSREVRDAAHSSITDDELRAIMRMYGTDRFRDPAPPEGVYRRLAGEVEARNVQARRNWTPEARRETPPWETADVPEADRIVRGILAP